MSVNSGGISYNNGARLKNATDLSLENHTYEMAGRFVLALSVTPPLPLTFTFQQVGASLDEYFRDCEDISPIIILGNGLALRVSSYLQFLDRMN